MPAPVAVRPQFSDLYGSTMLPVLEELFRAEFSLHPSRREQIFKMVNTDRDIFQTSEVLDLDLYDQIAEGEEFTFKAPKQGSSKTFTIIKWGLGFSVSEELVDDGKFNMVADMVRKLARSGAETKEINGMNVINNSYSSELTSDGVTVFNTAHPLPSGLSFRNRLAVDADLSVTALDQALVDMTQQQKGDSGILYDVRPKVLLVPPALFRQAKEIIGSPLKADTTDNNLNAFLDDGLRVVQSPHLTDADQWSLIANPDDTGLRIIVRKPLETKAAGPDLGFSTDSMYWKARFREDLGVTHAYGIFGSPGA
jgi:hypothetical protein